MEKRYYYFHEATKQNRGPTTQAGLIALSKVGEITPHTMVFGEGSKDWIRFADAGIVADVAVPANDGKVGEESTERDQIEGHTASSQPPSATTTMTHATSVKSLKRKMQISTSIRVENLPPNVTAEEISGYFTRRCGIIKRGLDGEERIKIYRPERETAGAAAIVTFSLRPSVELAIDLYDQSEFAPGYFIAVTEAGGARGGEEAEATGGETTATKTANTTTAAEDKNQSHPRYETEEARKKAARTRYLQERHLLSWAEEEEDEEESEENEEQGETEKARAHHESTKALRVVVLKHVFDPAEMAKEGERLARELHEDLVEGFAAEDVRAEQITLFKRHPEGIVVVRLRTAAEAARTVRSMHNRFFDGRRIKASMWDGVTLYGSPEDREEERRAEARRIEDFAKWLEGEEAEE